VQLQAQCLIDGKEESFILEDGLSCSDSDREARPEWQIGRSLQYCR